ncbi:MAG TPA: uroporphyrinogen-III C-methyltransferase [Azospira sp.]|nr:uroporphyrinogen-III C-methyltransferase [Azospira sp.]
MNAQAYLIGAGPGAADLLTLRAVKALAAADVLLVDDLVNPEVLAHARPGVRVVHVGKRCGGKTTPQAFIQRLMLRYARQGYVVGRVKGGDPLVFGRGGEEAEFLVAHGISVEVVPGITAGVAVPAALGIPVTHRACTRGVTFVTAHTQDHGEPDWAALARSGTTLVIYMGLSRLESMTAGLLQALPADWPAAVISRGTLPSQRQVVGTLADIAVQAREAQLEAPALVVVGEVVNRRWLALDLTEIEGQRQAA